MFTRLCHASEVPRERQHGPPASSAWYAAATSPGLLEAQNGQAAGNPPLDRAARQCFGHEPCRGCQHPAR
jgi:hypothetical protein